TTKFSRDPRFAHHWPSGKVAASGIKPNSPEDPPCMWVWRTLNRTSWVNRPFAGVVRKFGDGCQMSFSLSDHGSKLRGPSQNSLVLE
ncbi:hypothetical protein AVEN_174344-1, partial [Araneus ventricosus]